MFLTIFRGFTVPSNSLWSLQMGFSFALADTQSLTSCMAFSFISFCLFIFKIWSLTLIYTPVATDSTLSGPHAAIFTLSKPFSSLPLRRRPVALLLWGMLLAWMLATTAGQGDAPLQNGVYLSLPMNPLSMLVALAAVSLATWVELLAIVVSAMFFMIIGSWITMMLGMLQAAQFCREMVDFILGPFSRYPIRIGMLDLTPIVFFFVVNLAYALLRKFLLDTFLRVM